MEAGNLEGGIYRWPELEERLYELTTERIDVLSQLETSPLGGSDWQSQVVGVVHRVKSVTNQDRNEMFGIHTWVRCPHNIPNLPVRTPNWTIDLAIDSGLSFAVAWLGAVDTLISPLAQGDLMNLHWNAAPYGCSL